MYKSLFILLIALVFTSCGKDFSEDILGVWIPVMSVAADCDDPELNGILNYDANGCTEVEMAIVCQSLEFTENGNLVLSSTITIDGEVINNENTATYTLDGDRITTVENNNSMTGKISIDGNSMDLVQTGMGCEITTNFKRQ